MNATSDLKKDHLFVRRFGEVIQRCSDKIYADKDSDILLEDLEIASVIMEELIDTFHHGKEEEVYIFQVLMIRIAFQKILENF